MLGGPDGDNNESGCLCVYVEMVVRDTGNTSLVTLS